MRSMAPSQSPVLNRWNQKLPMLSFFLRGINIIENFPSSQDVCFWKIQLSFVTTKCGLSILLGLHPQLQLYMLSIRKNNWATTKRTENSQEVLPSLIWKEQKSHTWTQCLVILSKVIEILMKKSEFYVWLHNGNTCAPAHPNRFMQQNIANWEKWKTN